MFKNVTLAIVLCTFALVVGCGKDNQAVQKPGAPKALPELEIAKNIPHNTVVAIEATESNATHRISGSTLVSVPAFIKQNCIKLSEGRTPWYPEFSEVIEIHNVPCDKVKPYSSETWITTLLHNHTNHQLFSYQGPTRIGKAGSLLEIGRYPGPNVLVLRNLCNKFNKSNEKATCTFDMEPNGRIKSGSWKHL